MLNTHAKNAAYCAAALAAVVVPVYLVHDHVYVYVPLSGAVLDDSVWCDAECARRAEGFRDDSSFRCAEAGAGGFVCRSERGIGWPLAKECGYQQCRECGLRGCPDLEVSRKLDVTPVTYGEITTLLAGAKNSVWFFDVAHVEVLDAQEKRISVDFGLQKGRGDAGRLVHTAQMVPGDTFLTGCEEWQTPHLVTFTDLYASGDSTYAEFWGVHPAWAHSDPRPCDLAETVDRTLKMDYDIDLPGYAEFGFEP